MPYQVSDYNRPLNCTVLYKEVPYQVSIRLQPPTQLYSFVQGSAISGIDQITTAHTTVQFCTRKCHIRYRSDYNRPLNCTVLYKEVPYQVSIRLQPPTQLYSFVQGSAISGIDQITTAHATVQFCTRKCHIRYRSDYNRPRNCTVLYKEVPYQVSEYNRPRNCTVLYKKVPYQVSDYNRPRNCSFVVGSAISGIDQITTAHATVQFYTRSAVSGIDQITTAHATVQFCTRSAISGIDQITTAHATVQFCTRKCHIRYQITTAHATVQFCTRKCHIRYRSDYNHPRNCIVLYKEVPYQVSIRLQPPTQLYSFVQGSAISGIDQITTAHATVQFCTRKCRIRYRSDYNRPRNCTVLYKEVPYQVSDYNRPHNCTVL